MTSHVSTFLSFSFSLLAYSSPIKAFISLTLKESLKEVRDRGGEQRASLILLSANCLDQSGLIIGNREQSHGAGPRPPAVPSSEGVRGAKSLRAGSG